MKEERIRTLKAYEAKLQYRFRDLALLDQALTHRSYAHEKAASGIKDNERLEFLGDRILGAYYCTFVAPDYIRGIFLGTQPVV